ncbi:MAG: pyridoxal-phosphate dependent enzyme [Bacteroidota bacterium]
MSFTFPAKSIVEEAHARIKPYIHRTPLLTCKSIDNMLGSRVYFKCENFQKIGAFKARGATNAIFQLSDAVESVATHSSGNHAQAVAYAANLRGLKAYIVMPQTAPKVKVKAVKGYGAKVIFCEPNQTARENTLSEVVADTGATFIHPYDNNAVICGQASAAKELIEDTEPLDYLVVPVGGGGLLAGTALSAKYFSPSTKVIAGEPEGADDAYQSLIAGKILPANNPKTIADGLLTSLGKRNFPIIQTLVGGIITVSDTEIIAAMRIIWERMKIIIEPSCAVPLAVLIKEKSQYKELKIGVILTGGNVDLDKLPF